MTLRTPVAKRFWAKVRKSDGCWEWTGARTTPGYGTIRGAGRNLATHRYSWELHFGPIPLGMLVCHRCDNRQCVRPDHLFLGTVRDNQDDAKAKGRTTIGERNPNAILTRSQVVAIKAALASGAGKAELGRVYGVSRPTIQAIADGRNWQSV